MYSSNTDPKSITGDSLQTTLAFVICYLHTSQTFLYPKFGEGEKGASKKKKTLLTHSKYYFVINILVKT